MQVGLYLLLVLHIAEGCKLNDEKIEEITAYPGGSVLLPCYCTDPQATPGRFTWKKLPSNKTKWEEMSSERIQYRDRVQLVNGHSPGNLSLLISHLTEEDGGWYRCKVEGSIKDISLTVEGCTLTKTTLDITAHTGGSVLLPCSCTELRAKPKTFT
ncbi:protein turtle-like [Pygocentrus nattereri]|uniref:protein turtle-like n=1 Tax=Pygocentrus nattereri TaxID=42514 RepID=UPI001891213C|nr:protein turtle-like [Pygocentrus nattereri]